MRSFIEDPEVSAETIIKKWEENEKRAGQWPLVQACTELVTGHAVPQWPIRQQTLATTLPQCLTGYHRW